MNKLAAELIKAGLRKEIDERPAYSLDYDINDIIAAAELADELDPTIDCEREIMSDLLHDKVEPYYSQYMELKSQEKANQ